jgi:hypothetical protein
MLPRLATLSPLPLVAGMRRRRPRVTRRGRGLVPVLLMTVLAVGCGGGADTGTGGQAAQTTAAAGDVRNNLRGVCPDPVVIQTSWFPQVEHAVAYQLLGKGHRLDTSKKIATGPLVAHGGIDTGVRLQVRAGGPAIGDQQVSAQMYLHKSITLGMLATDETVQNSLRQPTTAVMAPFVNDQRIPPGWGQVIPPGLVCCG